MAYFRQRITKAGTVSTALVESGQGEPRQRVLVNLHGEPDTLRAVARLTVRRTSLLAERKELASGKADNDGKVVSATEASEVIASIDTKLAALAREQAILEQHCTATSKRIQAATQAYQRELKDAALAVLGRMMQLRGLGKQLKRPRPTCDGCGNDLSHERHQQTVRRRRLSRQPGTRRRPAQQGDRERR